MWSPMVSVIFQDNVVRVWTMDADSDNIACIATGYGHTHTVMAIAFFRHVSITLYLCNCSV